MKKLVIITGISGCGKTTLAKYLYANIELATYISLDDLKEDIYDIAGFHNDIEKYNLNVIVKDTFMKLLNQCMERQDNVVIVEYPFDTQWQLTFNQIVEKFEYEAMTIKIYTNDFNLLWEKLLKRDFSSQRHIAHELLAYNPKFKDEYQRQERIEYDVLKQEYKEEKYTTLTVGKEIKINMLNTSNLEYVLKEINSMK